MVKMDNLHISSPICLLLHLSILHIHLFIYSIRIYGKPFTCFALFQVLEIKKWAKISSMQLSSERTITLLEICAREMKTMFRFPIAQNYKECRWLFTCTINIPVVINWVKCTRDFLLLFLTSSYESTNYFNKNLNSKRWMWCLANHTEPAIPG